MRTTRLAIAASVVIAALSTGAQAASVTYTFSGTGSGTLNGVPFSGSFTATFTGNTTAVDMTNPPFYRLNDVGGSFTEGAVTATFVPTVTVESNSNLANIDFYNATFDNGLGYADPSLSGYMLTTNFGPLTVPPGTGSGSLTPTFNGSGDGFLTSAGLLEFTGDTSLTFSASVAPEPSAMTLVASGLLALGLAWRRRRLSR